VPGRSKGSAQLLPFPHRCRQGMRRTPDEKRSGTTRLHLPTEMRGKNSVTRKAEGKGAGQGRADRRVPLMMISGKPERREGLPEEQTRRGKPENVRDEKKLLVTLMSATRIRSPSGTPINTGRLEGASETS